MEIVQIENGLDRGVKEHNRGHNVVNISLTINKAIEAKKEKVAKYEIKNVEEK